MVSIFNDINQFNQFFIHYRQRFIQFAVTYIRDEVVAEDLFMEAIMSLWEKRHTFDENINPPAYLLAIIKNKSLNYLRHIQMINEVSEQINNDASWELSTRIATLEACEPEVLFTAEIHKIIDNVLSQQSATTARIFMLSRYENKSHKEIAEIMGMTAKGVEFHIAKVTKILRVVLKDYLIFFPFIHKFFF